jgi:hypothetical protein
MNISRQQQLRALIENLTAAPDYLDELAREKAAGVRQSRQRSLLQPN